MVLADLPTIASTNLSDSTTLVRNNTSNSYSSGSQDFTNASHLVSKNGLDAAKPATCAVGEVYFATDASAGQNWRFCTAVNTWSPQAAGGTVNTSGTATPGMVARFSGATSITDSILQDNGVQVSIGAPLIGTLFSAASNAGGGTILGLQNTTTTSSSVVRLFDDAGGQIGFGVNNSANTGGHVGFIAASGLGGINFATDTGDYVFQNHGFSGDMFRIYGTGGFVTVPVAGTPGGAPASGFGKFWFDTTAQTMQANNAANTPSTMVFPNACPGQVVQSISSGGVITCGAGGGGGGGAANIPGVAISSATATFFGNCASGGCNVDAGTSVVNFTATNAATAPAASSGSLYVYWAGASGCQAILSGGGSAVTISGSGPCSGVVSTSGSGFPNNATAIISRVDYGGAVWTGFVNYQPTATNHPSVVAGNGLLSTLSPGTQTLSIDTTIISTGTGTANFLSKFTGTGNTISNSLIQDSGAALGFNCAPGSTLAVFCSNAASVKAITLSNSNAGGHMELQMNNDGGLIGGFGLGGSSASDNANGIYLYNNIGGFNGWMSTGWTFRTGAFPGTVRLTIPTTGGVQYPTQTLAALGSCTSGRDGTVARAGDLTSIATWGATVTGGGTNAGMVVCNGATTAWTLMGK